MRTIHDLRDAFGELADTAPEPRSVPIPSAEPAPPRPRRRMLAPLAAAVAVVVLAAGVVVLAGPGDRSGRHDVASGAAPSVPALKAPAAHGAPDLTFRFTADAPAGTKAVQYGVDRGGQVIRYFPKNDPMSILESRTCTNGVCTRVGRPLAEVTLYWKNPSADADEPNFAIGTVVDRTPVDVNGHKGFYGRVPKRDDTREALFWQYAPGAWAEADAGDRAGMHALAESVRPASTAIKVPVDPTRTAGDQYLNTIDSDPSGGSFEVTAADHPGFEVGWGSGVSYAVDPSGTESYTAGGRTWIIRGGTQPHATLQGSTLPVTVVGQYNLSVPELKQYLDGLHLVPDLTDRSTWFDATVLE